LSYVLRRAAYSIAGAGKASVAEVIDAHLETVSMILVTTAWAVAYGWVEGVVGIGHLLATNPGVKWFGRFSTYHFVLGLTIFAISFSFGFLKCTRMLYHRKRYMLFTSLGNYPYALAAQDFSYFFFAPGDLEASSWTCQGLGLGCWVLKNPWNMAVPFVIPRWYLVALAISAGFFFLAYRSALVDFLVTRQVMKEIGFVEKFTAKPTAPVIHEEHEESIPAKAEESRVEREVAKIVDAERDELLQRLRARFIRQGA